MTFPRIEKKPLMTGNTMNNGPSSVNVLEVVVDLEKSWHLTMLERKCSSDAFPIQELTLTLRTAIHDNVNLISSNLHRLCKSIERMHHLLILKIYSDIEEKVHIRSSSIHTLVIQGLDLEKCDCPCLQEMDVSFRIHRVRHDCSLFQNMPNSVKTLTIRIQENSENDVTKYFPARDHHDLKTDYIGGMVENSNSSPTSVVRKRNLHETQMSGGDLEIDLHEFEEEIHKLLLKKMLRIEKLCLVPSRECTILQDEYHVKEIL